ncbi:hypothetical protein Dsin_024849 [Dipteronia sinensis]|uniref:GAT domain-containing protein n=1 Tax=Dipteronia sinensis TaxID=43782 RepID=A0AAD9ZV12_9ROSI|nr:hypothetical protein Dsin_024849 [Dipteronia sinensis]
MVEKCKESQPVIQRIIESTADDEGMLFEALNLNDELQQVISKYEELEITLKSGGELPGNSDTTDANSPGHVGTHKETKNSDTSVASSPGHVGAHKETKTSYTTEADLPVHATARNDSKAADSPKESTESSSDKRSIE